MFQEEIQEQETKTDLQKQRGDEEEMEVGEQTEVELKKRQKEGGKDFLVVSKDEN